MKKYILSAVMFFLALSILWAAPGDWSEFKSTHFIIYYKNTPQNFVEKLSEKAEYYYNKIADDLGFRRFDFWLWDNRAKIYVHDNAQDYQTATQQPAWSAGCAIMQEKVIHTFPYAQGFLETVLPHEMGHIIFREFVGFYNQAVPTWLDEGVASYQENLVYSSANSVIADAVAANRFIDLGALSTMNPHSMNDTESVRLFYAESVGAVDFLVKKFGKDNFIVFCQNLRDKQDLERAISYVYPFKNIQELSQAWKDYLTKA